jgi:flagellar biosynthesis/type III secretory pathway M-ring protein FliF/YscJ
MTFESLTAATTSWPEAAIAIAGVALVASVAVVVVWQVLATWRTRIAVTRDQQYRALAEQTARDLAQIKQRLGDDQGEEDDDDS